MKEVIIKNSAVVILATAAAISGGVISANSVKAAEVKTTDVMTKTDNTVAQTALKKLDQAEAADKKAQNTLNQATHNIQSFRASRGIAINPKVAKAVLDKKLDQAEANKAKADQNLVNAQKHYSTVEAEENKKDSSVVNNETKSSKASKRTAVLRGKKSLRFITINKKGKLVKSLRKAKPNVKYHVIRLRKVGKSNYAEISLKNKLGHKVNVLLNTKYIKFI